MWSSPVSTSSAAESSTCPTGPADYSRQSNGRQFVPQCAEGCVSDDKYKSSVYGSLAYTKVFTYLVGTCVFRISIQNPNNTCQSLCVPNNCVHAPVNSIWSNELSLYYESIVRLSVVEHVLIKEESLSKLNSLSTKLFDKIIMDSCLCVWHFITFLLSCKKVDYNKI